MSFDNPSERDTSSLIIAGASGLVGSFCLKYAINDAAIEKIYTLNRRQLHIPAEKTIQLIDPKLNINQWDETQPIPKFGIIALGTTRKIAGSKQGLEQVDYDLVCDVAQRMKDLGVERLAVVSSYGADAQSRSHYLRCKGRMEDTIKQMGFSHVTIVRPGPLVGHREAVRQDEIWLHKVMKVGQYLMFGNMKNLVPIPAPDVALAMIISLFDDKSSTVAVLHNIEMLELLSSSR